MLLYTFFNNQEFDFENIKLCDDTACYLRDYIEKCYKEINL
jgi:NADH:ubiquinone oxidoreductase subunit E